MNLKHLIYIFIAFTSLNAFGNVGIFGGVGSDIKLMSSAEIQMASEDIKIKLVPSKTPVTGNGKDLDSAQYTCNFKLRNLSNKKADVKIGFPISGGVDNILLRADDKVSRFNFKVLTNGKETPVSFEKNSADKNFSNIFLWNDKFAPNEEKNLLITYRTFGYMGLGMLRDRSKKSQTLNENFRIINFFEGSVMQGFEYVTLTGNSWANEISSAKFTIEVGEFECYLNSRGFLAEDENQNRSKVLNFQKALRNGVMFREVKPAGWTLSDDKKSIEINYAPFVPRENISITYYFTTFPKDCDGLKTLFEVLEIEQKKSLTPEDKRLICDVILEFYGVETNNKKIKNFLDTQIWYPAKNPPELDETLKAELLK